MTTPPRLTMPWPSRRLRLRWRLRQQRYTLAEAAYRLIARHDRPQGGWDL